MSFSNFLFNIQWILWRCFYKIWRFFSGYNPVSWKHWMFFVFSENGISNIWRREHVPHLLIFLTFPGMVAPLHHFPVELFQCLTTLSVINFFLVFNLSNRKQTRWNDYYFKFVKWVSISGFSNMVVGGTHTQNRLSTASPTVPTCDDKPILFSEVKQAEGWCKEMKTAEHHRYSEDG